MVDKIIRPYNISFLDINFEVKFYINQSFDATPIVKQAYVNCISFLTSKQHKNLKINCQYEIIANHIKCKDQFYF